jgi:hypothetical protein
LSPIRHWSSTALWYGAPFTTLIPCLAVCGYDPCVRTNGYERGRIDPFVRFLFLPIHVRLVYVVTTCPHSRSSKSFLNLIRRITICTPLTLNLFHCK